MTSREITFSSESISVDPEEIYKIYRAVADFSVIPGMHTIYGEYCALVDSRLTELQQSLYLDDYDASSGNIPDYIRRDITRYIGLPIDMKPEEVMLVLDRASIAYWKDGWINSPLKEVW